MGEIRVDWGELGKIRRSPGSGCWCFLAIIRVYFIASAIRLRNCLVPSHALLRRVCGKFKWVFPARGRLKRSFRPSVLWRNASARGHLFLSSDNQGQFFFSRSRRGFGNIAQTAGLSPHFAGFATSVSNNPNHLHSLFRVHFAVLNFKVTEKRPVDKFPIPFQMFLLVVANARRCFNYSNRFVKSRVHFSHQRLRSGSVLRPV